MLQNEDLNKRINEQLQKSGDNAIFKKRHDYGTDVQNKAIENPENAEVKKAGKKSKNKAVENEAPIEQKYAKVVDLSTISRDMKTYKSTRSKSQVRESNVQWESFKNKNKENSKQDTIADTELVKNSAELLLRDKKWTRFFFAKESPEMKKVKEAVAYLNNLLDKEVKTVGAGKEEKIDVKYLMTIVIPAYQTAYDACDNYVSERSKEGNKKGYGARRLGKVKNMLSSLRKEMNDMKLVVENLQSNQKIEFMESDIALNNEIIDEAVKHKMPVRHLVGEVIRRKAVVCTWIPEGNSSETYRVKVEDDAGNVYYVKKEEQLLNEDLSGYLEERISQLKRSQAIKKDNVQKNRGKAYYDEQENKIKKLLSDVENGKKDEKQANEEILKIRAEREELRLEGKIDEKDYALGIELLEAMQKKLKGLKGDAKNAQIDQYLEFFRHDFDDFFKRMENANAVARKYINNQAQIDALIATLSKEKKPGWEKQVADLRKMQNNGLKEMNELEWINAHKEEFGLDGSGKEIMAVLKKMGEDKTDAHRISKLFQRTLGKRAELYGQQASRSGISPSEVLASNNTATARLAAKYGFGDVVTTSFKGKLDFPEVGQTKSSVSNVTFSQAAPGEELLQVMEDAQKLQKEKGLGESIVRFSPEAIRQLSRMQTFDLMTLQTDRHWRNIKATVDRTKDKDGHPVWIVKTTKCYDHDQSFGRKNLKEYFKDLKNPTTGETKTVGEGFLKPIMMTVSKKSNIYRYAVQNKMTKENAKGTGDVTYKNLLSYVGLPKSKTRSLDKATANYKKDHDQKDQYTANPFDQIPRVLTTFEWSDKAYFDYEIENNLEGQNKWSNSVKDQEGKEARIEQGKRQHDLVDAMLKRNPGKEADIKSFFQKMYKLCINCSTRITSTQFRAEDKYLCETKAEIDAHVKRISDARKEREKKGTKITDRNELYNNNTSEKYILRTEFIKKYKELVELYEKLDFTHLEEDMDDYASKRFTGGENVVGYYDYVFQGLLHQMKLMLQKEPKKTQAAMDALIKEEENQKNRELEKSVEETARKQGHNLSKKQKQEEVEKLRKKEMEETVRVPAVLHMDLEAFKSIEKAYNNPEELDLLLMDLELTQDKKDAIRERLGQIIEQAKEAEKAVNEWADKKGLPKNAIERKFFLKKEEWAQVKNITDVALDPGESYFSVEDSQFMMGNQDMQKFFTTEDREVARKITNEERTTQRQKMNALSSDDNYTSYVNNKIAS